MEVAGHLELLCVITVEEPSSTIWLEAKEEEWNDFWSCDVEDCFHLNPLSLLLLSPPSLPVSLSTSCLFFLCLNHAILFLSLKHFYTIQFVHLLYFRFFLSSFFLSFFRSFFLSFFLFILFFSFFLSFICQLKCLHISFKV